LKSLIIVYFLCCFFKENPTWFGFKKINDLSLNK